MIGSRSMFRSALAICALAFAAAPTAAQRVKRVQEFTRQGLLITNFVPGGSADMRTGRRAADLVRERVDKLADGRELELSRDLDVRTEMVKAGFDADSALGPEDMNGLARVVRADEYLLGSVTRGPEGYRLSARLVLLRDGRLRQPYPEVVAPRLEDAARRLGQEIAASRAQLPHQRRCENALKESRGQQALQAARDGIAAFSRGAIIRTCLVWALRATGATFAEIVTAARQVLAIDSASYHALESGALALDSLERREEAADMWLRLAATDSGNLELAVRVVYSLADGGNGRRAEPFVSRVSDAHPDHLALLRLKWRVAYDNKSWKRAMEAGEALLERDAEARRNPAFFLRLATVYAAAGLPVKALETTARGVSAFPSDARLYALYTQYVRTEADSVLPRGLAAHPNSAELRALEAKELRATGRLAESLEASRMAVRLDSTLTQAELLVAQGELDLGRPDSALASLRRALARGEDSAAVAQFALSKGTMLYRAANGTRAAADFGLALRFLWFADSLRPSPQSGFMIGAAAFGATQAALTEAPKATAQRGCELAQLGARMLPIARERLLAGRELAPSAAQQSLDYLTQLEPYAGRQISALCGAGAGEAPGFSTAAPPR